MDYPKNWPKCVNCGAPRLDGHLTCGRAECDEAGARRRNEDEQRQIEEADAYHDPHRWHP